MSVPKELQYPQLVRATYADLQSWERVIQEEMARRCRLADWLDKPCENSDWDTNREAVEAIIGQLSNGAKGFLASEYPTMGMMLEGTLDKIFHNGRNK